MKDLSTSVRPEAAESEISFGGSAPEVFEKRHLKEIVMNGEAKELETEHKISSSTDELKAAVESECEKSEENSEAEVTSNNIDSKNSLKQSEYAVNSDCKLVVKGDTEEKPGNCQESVSNGNCSDSPKEVSLQDENSETNIVKNVNGDKVEDAVGDKVEDTVGDKVEDAVADKDEHVSGNKVIDVEGRKLNDVEEIQLVDIGDDKVNDEGTKIEEVKPIQVDTANESPLKIFDDASSTEDEDIRLVVEDETDIEMQEAKTPDSSKEESEKLTCKSEEAKKADQIQQIEVGDDADKEPVKSPEKTTEKEVPSNEIQDPSSPIASGIALDNITSNFDEDSCASFDKSLEEIDPKKSEDENKTPEDDVPAEKTPVEAMIIEPEDSIATSNEKVATMEIGEVKEDRKEPITEPSRKRAIDELGEEKIDPKKLKTDETDIKEEVGISSSEAEKLKGVVRNMTRKELEKFLVDAFIANMTRKSQMAVQEQELNKAKLKCESYKRTITTLQKQFVDLQKAVTNITELNKNAGKFSRPKTIVRNVSVQVPSKNMSTSTAPLQQPQKPSEKKIRTLPPVQRINNTPATGASPPNLQRAAFPVSSLGRPPINRQVLVQKQGGNMYSTSNSPALLASLKSPPKTSMANRTSSAPTLTTTDSPVQIVQSSGGRYIIPQGMQGSKTPVAYIISNSKTQPMLMQNGVPGLLSVKSNNGSIQSTGRSPNMLQRTAINPPTNTNLQGQHRQVMANAVRNRVIPQVKAVHPAPLPPLANQMTKPGWKALPPKPSLKIQTASKGIMLSWHLPQYGNVHEEIKSYQIYAYQETSEEPDSKLWKTVGDVKALALPMACTLTQFKEGYKYHFSVRAVDIHNRMGANSETMSIILQKKHQDGSNQSH